MNDLTLQVLRALSQGQSCSGEALARTFRVSRATIHNSLKNVDRLGISVVRTRGLGYRLADGPTWLDVEQIIAAAGSAGAAFYVRVEPACESTNSSALQLARRGAPSKTVVAAELQTRGRGRRGRSWESELGSALTFSLLWRFDRGVGAMCGLSLVVGVALARALRRLGVHAVMLKWPNDLLLHSRKLGGILIEVEGDALGPSAAVIGVGINVRLTPALRDRIAQPVSDLSATCIETLDRNALLGTMLHELALALALFEASGFSPFRAEWHFLHAHQDRPITLLLPDGSCEQGIARGVDANGALLLDQEGATRTWLAGEISLRA